MRLIILSKKVFVSPELNHNLHNILPINQNFMSSKWSKNNKKESSKDKRKKKDKSF